MKALQEKIDEMCRLAIDVTKEAEEPSAILINVNGRCGALIHGEDRDDVIPALLRPLNNLLKQTAEEKGVDDAVTIAQALVLCMAGSIATLCKYHGVSKKQYVAYMMSLENSLHDGEALMSAVNVAQMDMFLEKRKRVEL